MFNTKYSKIFNYERLTATTLIYATGAGITAAAGTRLALQLLVVERFNINSFPIVEHKSNEVSYAIFTRTTNQTQYKKQKPR